MMGRLNRDQGQLFYSFCLDEVVPDDHRAREISAVLDVAATAGVLREKIERLNTSIEKLRKQGAGQAADAQSPAPGSYGSKRGLVAWVN